MGCQEHVFVHPHKQVHNALPVALIDQSERSTTEGYDLLFFCVNQSKVVVRFCDVKLHWSIIICRTKRNPVFQQNPLSVPHLTPPALWSLLNMNYYIISYPMLSWK